MASLFSLIDLQKFEILNQGEPRDGLFEPRDGLFVH